MKRNVVVERKKGGRTKITTITVDNKGSYAGAKFAQKPQRKVDGVPPSVHAFFNSL